MKKPNMVIEVASKLEQLVNQSIDSQYNEAGNGSEVLFDCENVLGLDIFSTSGGKFSDLHLDTLVYPEKRLLEKSQDQPNDQLKIDKIDTILLPSSSSLSSSYSSSFFTSEDDHTTRHVRLSGPNDMKRRRLAHQFIRSGSKAGSETAFYCRSPLTPIPIVENFNTRILQEMEQYSNSNSTPGTCQQFSKLQNPSLDSLLLRHYATTGTEDEEESQHLSPKSQKYYSSNDQFSSTSSSSSVTTSLTHESTLGLYRSSPASFPFSTIPIDSVQLQSKEKLSSQLKTTARMPPLQHSLETIHYRSHISSTLFDHKTKIKTYLHKSLKRSESELRTRLTEFDTLKSNYKRLKLHVLKLKDKLQTQMDTEIACFEANFLLDVEATCSECAERLRLLEESMEKCIAIKDRDVEILKELEGILLDTKTSCCVNNNGLSGFLSRSYLRCFSGVMVDTVVFCLLIGVFVRLF